jgi:hypothetical protein
MRDFVNDKAVRLAHITVAIENSIKVTYGFFNPVAISCAWL